MNIIVIGINYNTAPVKVRECFTFNEENKTIAIQTLHKTKSVQECVIVETCNRTEIYAVVDNLHTGKHYIKSFLSTWFNISKVELEKSLYSKEKQDAVNHLFRVASGLDSMILGETQILGQVKSSFFQSQNLKATGKIFNRLFKQSITFAKGVHTNTSIGKNAVSVGYAAIELIKQTFEDFDNKSVVILGAGKMGELTAKLLDVYKISNITVVNRTYERAKRLADRLKVKALAIEDLSLAIKKADIVFSTIRAENYIINSQDLQLVLKERSHRPLYMVDIAVPRSLDPDINRLDNVILYNIDDLNGIVKFNLKKRAQEAEKIEQMIDGEVVLFKTWLNSLEVVPLITALHSKSFTIQEEALRSIENKLPSLSERELKTIRKHTKSIVNQMIHGPLKEIKGLVAHSNQKDREDILELFIKIFALEEEIIGQIKEAYQHEEMAL
ncbi:glutamyl-tRNA reductase [Metabacillus herbersteinensis]|uniref:Glutamyl-tRNA reductase n=1 Tax=Metabacillus herbersteinensis TaxID=283816 RepID=A0ABV6GG53_9BACI